MKFNRILHEQTIFENNIVIIDNNNNTNICENQKRYSEKHKWVIGVFMGNT